MSEIEEKLRQAKTASYTMATLTEDQKNSALNVFAQLVQENRDFLKKENQKDLDENKGKISDVLYQRLALTDGKIDSIIQGIKDLTNLPDPVGQVLEERKLKKGPTLKKVSVPLGVIGIVFESRPDVNPQIISLVLKSGNATVLKGGSEAKNSNRAFQSLVEKLNEKCDFLPSGWAQIIETRDDFSEMLKYHEYLDLVVPRGSNQLVQKVMSSTQAPVLGHADGICHLYVHPSANIEKALEVILESKCQYPSACNAVETLLIDQEIASSFVPRFQALAKENGIEIIEPHSEDGFRVEYGEKKLSLRIVSGVKEAIDHINCFGSHHTDGILAEDNKAQEEFQKWVDSACVFVNASTRFADGFRFGMGAEIGISTSKTHARGPVGLEGLVIYKYLLDGDYSLI